jgi:hypothetical protein
MSASNAVTAPRCVLTVLMVVAFLAVPLAARAQSVGKVPRIGYL